MTTITNPIDLLAAVPFLIGYEPSDSIVLVALEKDAMSIALRIDFPAELTEKDARELVNRLGEVEELLMVSYIPDDLLDVHRSLGPLFDAITSSDIVIRESIIVAAGRWRSLICQDEECCPVEGSPLPELSISRVAVEEVAQGKVMPFISLAAMEDSLRSEPDLVIANAAKSTRPIDYSSDPTFEQREGANSLLDFLQDFRAARICNDKALVGVVLARLRDLQVRDFALGIMNDEESDLYFSAWRWLMKVAPNGFVAAPATLFAVACYERGDGALANLALAKARQDQPKYAMVELLAKVFGSGQPPQLFKDLRAQLHPKVCQALFSGSMPA